VVQSWGQDHPEKASFGDAGQRRIRLPRAQQKFLPDISNILLIFHPNDLTALRKT
jgi:hypothetical protein